MYLWAQTLALVLVVAVPAATGAPALRHATYYVDSRAGNDARSGRSPAEAWRSLARAESVGLHGGDRLLLRRGSSWPAGLTLASSGTPSRSIVVAPYGRGRPPLIHDGQTCVRVTGSFVRLTGIAVKNCAWAGVSLVGSFVRVDHARIGGAAAGIEVTTESRDDELVRNDLIGNDRMAVLTPTPTNDDSGAFGILLRGQRTLVTHNRIEGSDAFSYDYGRDGSAVEVYGGRDNVIVRNVAVDDHAFTELGNPQSFGNTYAYNLFVTRDPKATFLVTRGAQDSYGPVRGTRVYNTTAVLTGARSEGVVCYDGCGPGVLRMRNDVVVATADALQADAPFDEASDVFWGGIDGVRLGPRSVRARPRFRNARARNFRLLPTSPAIDRGVSLGYSRDLVGTQVPLAGKHGRRAAPDAGCFEYRPAR
ncbi:MAG TPA: hypothetical protein VFU33_04535 [Gaiellaceae bacterium]|nr:hypothetical protein [Gaiellaceae bacterium]